MAVEIIDTNLDNILTYGVCGYKNLKHEGLRRKIEWLKGRLREGMKIKTLHSDVDGTQGMIEYLPGGAQVRAGALEHGTDCCNVVDNQSLASNSQIDIFPYIFENTISDVQNLVRSFPDLFRGTDRTREHQRQ